METKGAEVIDASNMTHAEYFRLNGTLNEARCRDLIDLSGEVDSVSGIDAQIEEGMAQYPAKDFLAGIMDRLHALTKTMRGANRDDLKGIIEALDDLAQTTFYASEYGREELNKALTTLGNLT